jgi:hypothetical protein
VRLSLLLPLATVAALSLSTQAGAVVTVSVDSGNLDAFSYTVSGRTIRINEVWGPSTLQFVNLKIAGIPVGSRPWTIIKTVTNNTGKNFKFFETELLNTDKSQSDNLDGLSFAQNSSPKPPKISTVFDSVFVDELFERDYIRFFNGSLDSGSTGEFRFGLTVTKLPNNSPFFLRQSGIDVIPEPATWAMLIAGFGMVGFALRRRKGGMTSVSA